MRRILVLTILAGMAVGCSPEPASGPEGASAPGAAAAVPVQAGVCWRREAGGYAVVDRVPNLPTCAQRLEAVRMMQGGSVDGAYEGRTIRVTEAEIDQGRPGGERYPVFTTGQRREMQAAIQALLDQRGAAGGDGA